MCFLVMPVIINRLTQILLIAFYCTYFSTVILLMSRPTRAILNWANYRHNYELARKLADGMAYAVVKANGYGHGMLNCARALSEADGFAVACVDEEHDVTPTVIDVRPPTAILWHHRHLAALKLDAARLLDAIQVLHRHKRQQSHPLRLRLWHNLTCHDRSHSPLQPHKPCRRLAFEQVHNCDDNWPSLEWHELDET